ncbi:MAG TPA: AMP-dependent synthetase [Bacteroides sp.]|nr:AMP-dependent synthetase [Bacteroides sp.]
MGDWDSISRNFKWKVPKYFNIARVVCDRHALDRYKFALFYEDEKGNQQKYTFWELQQKANRLANVLTSIGIKKGDRVGIILPQRPETAISHLAIYKIGAIALPLAVLFGKEALRYRLSDSSARAVIVDADNIHKIHEIRNDLESLEKVLLVGGKPEKDEIEFEKALNKASKSFRTVKTKADDPAIIIYTSGTTGNPKGALHAHRYLLGHLTGFELSHNFFPQRGDISWTAADWAWIGGLMDILMPSWFYGIPVVAYRGKKFDPEKILSLLEKYGVRNIFMPPTGLKMIRQVKNIKERFDIRLRTIMSGGEALGAEVLSWAQEELNVRINEIYGQTEANYVIGNCAEIMDIRPGSMGKSYPGHIIDIIDDNGNILPPGVVGEIAFRRGADPVFFLGYWNNPTATQEKFKGDWACSGDTGMKDEEGYFWFKGRKDDVIISAGYRIGPTEIEESLIKHPAVALSAVVASPDEFRGSIVKAFVKLATGCNPSHELARELQEFVKKNLAAHEYPREIEFIDDLPMTTTGKIKRRDLRLLEEQRKKK